MWDFLTKMVLMLMLRSRQTTTDTPGGVPHQGPPDIDNRAIRVKIGLVDTATQSMTKELAVCDGLCLSC